MAKINRESSICDSGLCVNHLEEFDKVYARIEKLDEKIQHLDRVKVSLSLFKWVVGGICTVAILLFTTLFTLNLNMNTELIKISTVLKVEEKLDGKKK